MANTKPIPHPKFQDRHGQTWYLWKDTAVLPHVADMYAQMKRLTDAELAAELHRAKWTGLLHDATVERFATLPHFDEVPE